MQTILEEKKVVTNGSFQMKWDTLRDSVPIIQSQKREKKKQPWRSVPFGKVAA